MHSLKLSLCWLGLVTTACSVSSEPGPTSKQSPTEGHGPGGSYQLTTTGTPHKLTVRRASGAASALLTEAELRFSGVCPASDFDTSHASHEALRPAAEARLTFTKGSLSSEDPEFESNTITRHVNTANNPDFALRTREHSNVPYTFYVSLRPEHMQLLYPSYIPSDRYLGSYLRIYSSGQRSAYTHRGRGVPDGEWMSMIAEVYASEEAPQGLITETLDSWALDGWLNCNADS